MEALEDPVELEAEAVEDDSDYWACSIFLNEDGTPMKFYICPCKEKRDLRRMIEREGGLLVGTYENDAIHLVSKEFENKACHHAMHSLYRTQFIRDCVAKDVLLPLEQYELRPCGVLSPSNVSCGTISSTSVESCSGIPCAPKEPCDLNPSVSKESCDIIDSTTNDEGRCLIPSVSKESCVQSQLSESSGDDDFDLSETEFETLVIQKQTAENAKRKTRKPYTFDEEKLIMEFIIENDAFDQIKGKQFWMHMEFSNKFPGRSWMSLKEHFQKKMCKRLDDFKLTNFQKKLLLWNLSKASTTTRQSCSRQYTDAENKSILKFICDNNVFHLLKGKSLYQRMKSEMKSARSWQSLKEHVLKHMIPELYNFDLDPHLVLRLSNFVSVPEECILKARNELDALHPAKSPCSSHSDA